MNTTSTLHTSLLGNMLLNQCGFQKYNVEFVILYTQRYKQRLLRQDVAVHYRYTKYA